jgi:N-acetylmuramoyl-L-alanine amidase
LLLVLAASLSWGELGPRESSWIVAIDAGHSAENPGAYSARGTGEYTFNSIISSILLDELKKHSRIDPVLINKGGDEICLAKRVDLINQAKPDLLVSIHHDSVQPSFLTKWVWKGKSAYYCDRYSGFSVFYSEKNEKSAESLRLALLLGQALLEEGYLPSLHHAEKIKGENRQIVDRKRGVYRFDDLAVLKSAKCPGVLLECGIIKNRRDELLLRSYPHQLKISTAIMNALLEFTAELEQSRGRTSVKASE